LEDRREFESARYTAWMQATADEVRRRAAISLGRIGDRRATPLLLTALSDSSPRVRRDAAFALGILDDSSMAVVNGLWRVAMGNDSAAVEAIAALSRLGGGYPIVEARVNDAAASPQVRGEALLALP